MRNTESTQSQEPASAPLPLREQGSSWSPCQLGPRDGAWSPGCSPSQTLLPQGPGPATHLERVQVAESTQGKAARGAGHPLVQACGWEGGHVAGGQHQHIQLGQLGVRRHGRQGACRARKAWRRVLTRLRSRAAPQDWPRSAQRTQVSGSDRTPITPGAKCILGQGLLPE